MFHEFFSFSLHLHTCKNKIHWTPFCFKENPGVKIEALKLIFLYNSLGKVPLYQRLVIFLQIPSMKLALAFCQIKFMLLCCCWVLLLFLIWFVSTINVLVQPEVKVKLCFSKSTVNSSVISQRTVFPVIMFFNKCILNNYTVKFGLGSIHLRNWSFIVQRKHFLHLWHFTVNTFWSKLIAVGLFWSH